ncbi:peptidylprolyl isomerase [Candidatus Pantoea edessiphila]|uniref:Periplasmic chaperone PpiD n=1 Tax=Candidatus Pantoea edessiphila TaxID=2044610 RepID=A0A2P5T1G5_9GAMM|nr:peptidylprolyl isomerase [Candidatus Pantoea edessiphila]PPI88406.1 peptidylprolyl isomerase [Candidatus Pantoea edessiphila]
MSSFGTLFNSLITRIILGLVILIFVVTNISGYLIHNRDYIAKVDGQKITSIELERAFNYELNQQRQNLGNSFNDLIKNNLYLNNIRQQVINYLINRLLLSNYANDLSLCINDDQLKKAIFNKQIFQVDGKFDNDKYNNIINKTGLTADQYVELLRKEISIQQLIQILINSDFILKGEAKKLGNLFFQKRIIRQAIIDVNLLAKKQTVNNEEIKEYYQQYADDFVIPEKFRISYIKLNANNIKQKTINESDIKDWYNKHKDNYYIEGRNRYRIIQTKTEINAKNILQQLNKGVSFYTLARTMSVDPISARKGGDIGWMYLSAIPQEIKTSNLTKKGQVSDIIKLPEGFLIVYLDDIKKGRTKSLSEVYGVVVDEIKKENMFNSFNDINKKVSAAALNNDSLNAVETQANIKANKTTWFTIDKIPKDINYNVIKEALSNTVSVVGTNSDVIKLDNYNSIVIHIDERKEKSLKPINQVRLKIINIIKQKKAQQQAKLKALNLLNAKDIKKSLAKEGITLSKYKIIGRNFKNPINNKVFELLENSSENNNRNASWGFVEDEKGNIVLIMLNKIVKEQHLQKNQINKLIDIIEKDHSQIMIKILLNNLSKHASVTYNYGVDTS